MKSLLVSLLWPAWEHRRMLAARSGDHLDEHPAAIRLMQPDPIGGAGSGDFFSGACIAGARCPDGCARAIYPGMKEAKVNAYRDAVEQLSAAVKELHLNPPDWQATFDRVTSLAEVCAQCRRELSEI